MATQPSTHCFDNCNHARLSDRGMAIVSREVIERPQPQVSCQAIKKNSRMCKKDVKTRKAREIAGPIPRAPCVSPATGLRLAVAVGGELAVVSLRAGGQLIVVLGLRGGTVGIRQI